MNLQEEIMLNSHCFIESFILNFSIISGGVDVFRCSVCGEKLITLITHNQLMKPWRTSVLNDAQTSRGRSFNSVVCYSVQIDSKQHHRNKQEIKSAKAAKFIRYEANKVFNF